MKILLDENIDVRFKSSLSSRHETYTIRDMNWNGIRNGQLLVLLKENNFDAWIVVDKNIPYQQNIANLPCTIIVLNVYRNTLRHLLPLVPKILEAVQSRTTNKVIIIEPD